MKTLRLIIAAALVLNLAACNVVELDDSQGGPPINNDDDNGGSGEDDNTGFFSLSFQDTWTYDVTQDEDTQEDTLNIIQVFLDGTADLQSPDPAVGIMTLVFDRGTLQEDDNDALIYNGVVDFQLTEDASLTLDLSNAIVYDPTQALDTVIYTDTQTVTQEIEGLPITFDVTITSTQLENDLANLEAGGMVFEEVIRSNLTIEASGSITVAGVAIELLQPQVIYDITNEYAMNVGLVNSVTNFQYTLEDVGVELPFPSEVSSVITQVISNFDVAED